MNNKRGKKGISDLIATVLMILVTIAAVGIISYSVMPIIRGTIESSQKCSAAVVEMKSEWTCYDNTKKEMQVSLVRSEADAPIIGLQVQIFGDGKGLTRTIKNATMSAEIKEYGGDYNAALSLPRSGEARTYVFNTTAIGISSPETVSVSTIILIGKSEKNCGITAQTTAVSC